MTRWRADERYTALVAERGAALLRLAVLMTGNRHDAEDVVQGVLIAAASAWPVAQPVAYLKRAVANRSIDVIRKRRDVLTDAPPERPVDDAGYLRHDETRAFFELVRALPERQRGRRAALPRRPLRRRHRPDARHLDPHRAQPGAARVRDPPRGARPAG
ncbi:sigma factor [Galbitalea sp. SE-J8]|uniref:sigma factor n=1 Tax=Galbitalea sp. SE-J8 TaxID=3054952 RepID=UPI00259CC5FF|nr:sigma factor [Galbitalea sp. SE-J8]MDM4764114.1 sigma factor [Galbitalea sp. SE-J8]